MTGATRFEAKLNCAVPQKTKAVIVKLAAEENRTPSDIARELLSESIARRGLA
jgi:hypothetical protein